MEIFNIHFEDYIETYSSMTTIENPIFFPQRKKLKGYQKQNRKVSFNKNR